MKKLFVIAGLLFLETFGVNAQSVFRYTISQTPWAEWLGNQRAVINVPSGNEVAHLNLAWRRHDKEVEKRCFIIINAETNDTVKNIYRLNVTNENCELFFGPVTTGLYYFYYLPYQVQEGWGGYRLDYLHQKPESNLEWVSKNNLTKQEEARYVDSDCKEIQVRLLHDTFYPMEIVATQIEKDALIMANGSSKFLLFPEDRKYPIRMLDNIPQKWILDPPGGKFTGSADLNEYFTFQIGLWAVEDVENVTLRFFPLKSSSNEIPASALTCFNTGGIDPSGKPFTKNINVAKTKLQPLWIGIDISQNVPEGNYKGKLTVKTKNAGEKDIDIELNISNNFLANRGDGDAWRQSRLRWLNSRAGIDDNNIAPLEPIKMNANAITLSYKDLIFNNYGMPASIKVFNEEVLSAPIKYSITSKNREISFTIGKTNIIKQAPGIVIKENKQASNVVELTTHYEIESDGWMKYTFDIEAKKDIKIDDIQLDIPYKKEIAQYIMGMGLPGAEAPATHEAKWQGPHDAFWIGDTRGGLYCELRGASYTGPLLNLYHPAPPVSWDNQGKGGFRIKTEGNRRDAIVYSGGRELKKGDKLQFECAFLITPVKKIDTRRQFTDRYYQSFINEDIEQFIPKGLSIINILPPKYTSTKRETLNNPPYDISELKEVNSYWHSKGLRIKSYYQTREIYDIPEIWAFRSLGTEILAGGEGKGHPWLREHYVDNYTPQWYDREDSVFTMTAILTSGISRLLNYYVEGIKWMVRETDCDGFYIDDSVFDREIIKRMKRVMNEIKPGCLIDLHSNTGFSKGPATQYAGYFPYLDKIWFGESFQYSKMPPANWLVEVSGIPFGLMGDMLQLGGNQWLGMVYGMTNRLGWITDGVYCDPTNVWEVWDKFGISDSKMVGYWDEKPVVSTSNNDVYATAYIKNNETPISIPPVSGDKKNNNKMLISLGNWSNENVSVKLNIDFSLTDLDPNKVVIKAPYIKNFQPERIFQLHEEIPVEHKKGWLLIVEEQ